MTGRAYRLTGRAEQDIIEIYLEGLSRFGEQQADRYHQELTSLFERIALNPQNGERTMGAFSTGPHPSA